MGEDLNNTQSRNELSGAIRYLPYAIGIIGLFLLLFGLYLSFQPPVKKAPITIVPGENIAGPAASSGKTDLIKVDVEGALVNPGVYSVKSGSRLQDGLIAAGGFSEEADREWTEKHINLAAKLVDGSKIYIPKTGEQTGESQISNLPPSSGKGWTSDGQSKSQNQININEATLSELDTLPGVGAVTAQKIIDGRPYQKIEELTEKKVVNNGVWEKIKDKVSVY